MCSVCFIYFRIYTHASCWLPLLDGLNVLQIFMVLRGWPPYLSQWSTSLTLSWPQRCLLRVVNMCINTPLFLLFPSVLHPLVCPPLTVHRFKSTPSVLSLCCWFCLSAHHPLSVLQWQVFKEQLHTRVVLVAVEIWTDKDHIPISVRPLEMLRDFSKYRQQSIKHHADAVHLIS